MPKPSNSYSMEDHRRAFDLYFDLRSFKKTAAEMGIDDHTIRRWAGGENACSCPWHRWDDLIAERESFLDKRLAALESQDFYPLTHQQALLDADPSVRTTPERREQLRPASKVMYRTDAERLVYLEYLWSKAFYHATGIVTEHTLLVDEEGVGFDQALRQQWFSKGMDPKNFEGCCRVLKELHEQIMEIQKNLGLRRPSGAVATSATPSDDKQEQVKRDPDRPLTLEDLREMKNMLKHEPRERLEMLASALKAEDEIIIEPLTDPDDDA